MSSRYQPDRLRQRLVQVRIASFYRVIRKEYSDDPLGVVPRASRFSDPKNDYAVLYAAAGRALSSAVHASVPEADGFLFNSRFTGHDCVAIFDRATRKLTAATVTHLSEETDFLSALDDYEITIVDETL